ncbi:MAG: hypothetical protein PVF58_04450 [Candidatus Methanofastidiosia archaeon]|jgi:hypothetical protein
MIEKWLVLFILVVCMGCASQSPDVKYSANIYEQCALGVLPIPGEGQSFADAYDEASLYCDFVPVWGKPTPFYQLAEDISGSWGKTFVDTYIKSNGMIPLIHVSFMDAGITLKTPSGTEATLSDPEWRNLYKESILDIVNASNPAYLSLGNEVNRWYEKYGVTDDLNGFQHYISLYNEIYNSVKEVSPHTIVFCTFAREIVSENREADLNVLTLFDPDKLDILVFTSYPYALQGVNTPSDIPDDYYTKALQYVPGKPLGFSEVAWPSLDAFGGEKGQADFLRQVTGRLTTDQGIHVHLIGWPWLHDLENDSTGLITRSGKEKLVFDVWKELYKTKCKRI